MRTFGSLLRGGYLPPMGTSLYLKNQSLSHANFVRFNYGTKKKEMIFSPPGKKLDFNKLYLHPYYPGQPIHSVKIMKDFPFAQRGFVYAIEKGVLRLAPLVSFSEQDILLHPTFFKPIYTAY